MSAPKVVFFDLGSTLGEPKLSPSGALTGFEVFPFVPEILTRMSAPQTAGFGAKLGVISDTPGLTLENMKAILTAAGILGFFDPGLLLFSSVEGMDKKKKAFFTLAVTRAGIPANRCIFAGESDAERSVARLAGMPVAFHPLHAFHVLKNLD